ncbi:glycogen synthase [Thermus filiformis]|uniref:Glycogen synthase n=1 Tax=Thermus filiformis TaxID=276 RepID=A0A0A2WQM9_THEFI|nr:glycogen synthase [Thermus filiformis]KGQ21062.1 glycogen synthase [Thermus filiformis]
MVAAEAFPLLKVGGLADVVGALPKALRPLGVEATVLIPWASGIEARRVGEVAFSFAGYEERAALGERVEGGVRFWLLGLPDFARERLYGYPDDVRRFVRFALAARSLAQGFDLLHLHDWPAALLALYGFPTVYTIHNLAHQGLWDPGEFFYWTGLPWSLFHMEALEFYGRVNLMKGGIVFAQRVTTVSPGYAQEIQTPEFGEGLDGVLRRHRHKLRGILNGLDTEYWDPESDPYLPFPYRDWSGKARMEAYLAEALGLRPPVLGVVGRLVFQKGLDLVLEGLPHLLALGYSLAVLGSGEEALEEGFARAMRENPGRVHFQRGHDEALAHRIYAGSHAFLMPSRFEPCGLSQMIAMRYGTPPVARGVGGLKDTVRDGKTGVLFHLAHPEGLLFGLCRLEHLDREALGRAGMAEDFSWEGPARAYLEVYREVCG